LAAIDSRLEFDGDADEPDTVAEHLGDRRGIADAVGGPSGRQTDDDGGSRGQAREKKAAAVRHGGLRDRMGGSIRRAP